MSLIELIQLKENGDDRGRLVAIEQGRPIPFKINRVYYIFNTKKNVSRGFHAHKDLQQLLICVSGKCRVILDDGGSREEVWLDSPVKGLYVNNLTWREMHDFSDDCVLLVLASDVYDESDYIRDYSSFLEQRNESPKR